MSLINKMLKDLEGRATPVPARASKQSNAVYRDLRPVNVLRPPRRKQRLAVLVLALVVVAGAAVFSWNQFREPAATTSVPLARAKISPTPQIVSPAPVAPVESAATPTIAADTAPAPSPVGQQVAAESVAKPAVAPNAAPVPKPVASPPVPHTATTPPPAQTSAAAERATSVASIATDDAASQPGTQPAPPPVERATPAPTRKKTVVRTAPVSSSPEKVARAPAPHTVMDIKPHTLSSAQTAENRYREAVTLMQRGRGLEAAQVLKQALALHPEHVRGRELLVGISLQQGHWRDAIQTLEQGIAKVPTHYAFVQTLARVHVEQHNEPAALTLLESAAPAANGDADYAAFLATLYQRAGRHADAVKAYTHAVSLRPDEGRFWMGLGISFEGQQHWSGAQEAYTRARQTGTLNAQLSKYVSERLDVVKRK